jgi:glycosyltransferase involved in cell wall biosynthesis
MPRVSVALPVHNAASSLDPAIASMAGQTYSDWELIVIDDGSTDGSPDIARAWAQRDSRIRVVRRPHGGIVAALNAAAAMARGELIARMDADDVSLPRRLEAQVALLDADPTLGLVSCLVEYGGDRTAHAGYALHIDWLNEIRTPGQIALNRFVESPLAHPSVLFRTELLRMHGGYEEGPFPEDYALWLKWLDRGVRMAKVPEILLRWNDPPGRLSRTHPSYHPEAFFRTKARWIAAEFARAGAGRELWIWGAGRPTRKRAAWLEEHGLRIAGFIDVDAKKIGRIVGGCPVISPDDLPPPGPRMILGYVGSRGARELIRGALTQRNYLEGTDFLMCA